MMAVFNRNEKGVLLELLANVNCNNIRFESKRKSFLGH
jgi:hypothetical protein